MATLLVSHRFSTAYGAKVAAAAARDKVTAELLALPPDPVDELHPHRNRELRECDQDSRAQAAMSALHANHGKKA